MFDTPVWLARQFDILTRPLGEVMFCPADWFIW